MSIDVVGEDGHGEPSGWDQCVCAPRPSGRLEHAAKIHWACMAAVVPNVRVEKQGLPFLVLSERFVESLQQAWVGSTCVLDRSRKGHCLGQP
jgi:hypothetical protein